MAAGRIAAGGGTPLPRSSEINTLGRISRQSIELTGVGGKVLSAWQLTADAAYYSHFWVTSARKT